MTEIWKDIPNYEGLYQVSNFGNVRNIKSNRIKTIYEHNGYFKVSLCKNSKQLNYFVHRLVAEAFIDNPNNLPQVNHKDETRDNNSIDNLEWCTNEYNLNYGTYPQRILGISSIPVIQKTKTGEVIKVYTSSRQAERENGISRGRVSACLHGDKKFAGGYTWERGADK